MPEPEGFLARLDPVEMAEVERRWTVRRYERNETIIAHDEPGRDLFFVHEGRARATVYSDGGRAVAYRDIEPGGIFGELSAIDGKARSASVVALGPMRVARLSEAHFRDLVNTCPRFMWALLLHLADQMRRMTDRVYEVSTLVVRKRLVRELLRLAVPDRGDGPASISPAPTHSDLAAMISTHREAVSREMSLFAKRGLIERRGRRLILRDGAALDLLAGD
jgi:CRP/FNR family transcriptional regulator, cyclic AMP receptor protein